ncbi:MAG: polysaccharide biosynthesis protein [Candidatus Sumerlaeia bacterium]|nr:polysaccharide biosynthesis protein [Candidatus Sumerlaeia bacterium]
MLSPSPQVNPNPSRRDVVLGNSLLLGGVFLFNSVAGVLTAILLARLLSVEALGEYGYLFRVYSWLCAFAVFFLPQVLVRFVAELRGRKSASAARQLFRWAFGFQVVVVGLVVGCAVLPGLMGWVRMDAPFVVVLIAFAVNALAVVFENYLRGCQDFRPIARAVFVGAVVRILGLLSLFLLGADVLAALSVYTLGQMIYLALLATGTKSGMSGAVGPRKTGGIFQEFRSRIVNFGATMGLAGFLSLVTWNYVEVFIIGWTWSGAASAEQLAFYTLAISLSMLPNRLTKAMTGALSPAFAELHGANERVRIRRAYVTATTLSGTVGCFVVIYLMVFAPHVFHVLFPASLYSSIPVFQLLMIPALFLALNYAGGVLLPTLDGHRFHLVLSALAAPVTIAVAFLLIPRWGALGAATSNAIMQGGCVVASILFLATRRHLPFPTARMLLACLAAGISALTALYILGGPVNALFIDLGKVLLSILIAAPVYIILLRLLPILGADELDMILRCRKLMPAPLSRPWTFLARWVCA